MSAMFRPGCSLRSIALGALLSGALAGCATGPQAHPQDPLEPLNRQVSTFNDGLDRVVLKPVATAYRDTVPSPLRTGVNNFFGNWRDLWSAVNALLQAKPREAAESVMRVSVNTVFGLGGVLDVAGEMGIPRTTLDFGQTLGRWGVPSGPYLVLPVFGPSSVRDTVGLVVDDRGDVIDQAVSHVPTRNSAVALRVVDTRAGLLRAGALIDEVALDKYSFMRDAYLQRRRAAGAPEEAAERYDEE